MLCNTRKGRPSSIAARWLTVELCNLPLLLFFPIPASCLSAYWSCRTFLGAHSASPPPPGDGIWVSDEGPLSFASAVTHGKGWRGGAGKAGKQPLNRLFICFAKSHRR